MIYEVPLKVARNADKTQAAAEGMRLYGTLYKVPAKTTSFSLSASLVV
jgi:hypothetical protein